ncbi:TetR/AcrR family transcriptional regulator [Pseudonocardia spinosispora]|uniref:TetR/AcrR family transcriptional regulator n=1 Tax=Pseudonocardia spinosispora TaxID=103441 RepID=UPI0004053677|nr:TetR/AcrR family transcriptional regulator [Pseudonocardia spinosispora]
MLSELVVDAATDDEELTRRLLDAAQDELVAFGIRRASMESIAVKAGLARATLYRRFNKQQLVRSVVMRRLRRSLVEMVREVEALPTVDERLVEAFVFGTRQSRADDLLARLLESEPETVLPYFTTHSHVMLDLMRSFLADQLRRSPGPAIEADPDAAAEIIIRLASSIRLTPGSHIPLDSDEDLRTFAWTYLVPLLHTRPRSGPARQ